MSLKDPSDEYDELIPEGNNFILKFVKKNKLLLFALLLGIIIGVLIQYSVVDPILAQNMGNTTKDCTYAKDLLNQENDCLYTIISDENVRNASQICGAKALQEQTITPSKDFNEE